MRRMFMPKNTETKRPENTWCIKQREEGRLRYVKHEKSREWAKSSGLQLPGVGSHPVNGTKRIYGEADMVKLRERFLGRCHARGVPPGATTPDVWGNYLIRVFHGANRVHARDGPRLRSGDGRSEAGRAAEHVGRFPGA